jgi:hypothetical protein
MLVAWCVWMVGALAAHPVIETVEATRTARALRMADGVPAVSRADYELAAAGEVATGLLTVEGNPAKKSYGVTVFDVPIERVWAAINDESKHVGNTQLGYAELVKGRPCESGRRVLQYLPIDVPMVADRWWVTIRVTNDKIASASGGRVRELVWSSAPDGSDVTSEVGRQHMAAGVMVGFTRGSWYLTALDEGHTLVEYYTWVDPGGDLSPNVMSMFAGRSMRKTFEQMEAIARLPELNCKVPGWRPPA